MVEIFSENTQKVNQDTHGDRKGKRKVFDDGYNSSNGSLESGVDNPLLASQDIQGPATPATIHGNSVVFETVEGKEEKDPNTDQLQQSPKQKTPVCLFTTSVKPRLRWTTKLHARFVDAIKKLGGPQKATPKTLRDAMGLEGLDLHQVKSHLQKYRMGKLTVRDWPEIPKIRPSYGTSIRKQPSQANGQGKYKYKKVRKTYKPEKEGQGQELFMKLKDAEYQKNSNDLTQVAQKKLADQFNNVGAEANAAVMSRQDFPGEKIKGYSCEAYIGADAVNVSAGPQELTTSILSQNEAYTSLPQSTGFDFHSQSAAREFHQRNVSYSASNGFPTSTGNHSENTEYLRDFQPPTASYTFHSQSIFYDYQTHNAYYPFQLPNTSYNYQSQSSAYINQLQNAALSATNNLPSNVNYLDTAYLDDLTAALAMIGSANIGTLLNDPVDTYMVRDRPEPNAKDNGNNCPTM